MFKNCEANCLTHIWASLYGHQRSCAGFRLHNITFYLGKKNDSILRWQQRPHICRIGRYQQTIIVIFIKDWKMQKTVQPKFTHIYGRPFMATIDTVQSLGRTILLFAQVKNFLNIFSWQQAICEQRMADQNYDTFILL